MKKLSQTLLIVILVCNTSYAQNTLINNYFKQKSGNSRENLTDIFRLNINNLNAKNGEINFTTTIYGLKLKKNPYLAIDTNFIKENFNRNFQVMLGLKQNESTLDYNQGSFGITYAVINNRDKSILDLSTLSLTDNAIADIIANANLEIYKEKDSILRRNLIEVITVFSDANKSDSILASAFKKLDSKYKNLFNSLTEKTFNLHGKISYIELVKLRKEKYKELAELTNRKALLTINTNGNFDFSTNKISIGNVNLVYLKGLRKDAKKKPIDLEIKSGLSMGNDSTKKENNYDRIKLLSTLGINGVLLEDEDNISLIELKLFASSENVFQGLYKDEKQNIFAGNATFRMKISDNVWVPLTVKYDVTNANLFGFLNIAWNLENKSKSNN